jgi:uncharacterized protein (DUF362 family)
MKSSGTRLFVTYGSSPGEMATALLEQADPLVGADRSISIGIKPNLVVAKPASSGATTSPDLVEAVIEYLYSRGFRRVYIMESSSVGVDTVDAFAACGYEEVARRTGAQLVDLKRTRTVDVTVDGYRIAVFSRVLEVDYLINMPVLKAHCQTLITCALKNLKGCIPDSEKRRFHRLGLHEPIARLNRAVKSDFVIVDALCGDLTFEEGGSPVRMDRIVACEDPVAADAYCARLIGLDPQSVEYIRLAARYGVGRAEPVTVIESGEPDACSELPESGGLVARLTRDVHSKQACSACYGGLVHALYRLQEWGARRALNVDLYVGQGYRGVSLEGFGIGNCVDRASKCVRGCPPRAEDIVRALREL